ncbi:DNA topoisomerase [Oribacterium parvum]|uniref:DNA topoisomerase n=1 Tax=Oribacterium parvum TaxID=1501329 RepID=UPI0028DB73E3|nr:DNA topoisomerase [Oribacterium parvum]
MKKLFIAEKPSVAKQFAEALGVGTGGGNRGYLENQDYIFTWCVGHLISMSYPEKYDEELKKWKMESLPFIPKEYLYEVIPSVREQFSVVSALLQRKDLETIYICTDSGREGEYIYRLVASQCPEIRAEEKRVWIDSQTKEEILRGIREAKAKAAYDRLGTAAYLRAKEDYLMGINFSRVLTLRYGRELARVLGKEKSTVIAVGRVMSCVLAMIVQREMEIRAFQKTSFWKLLGDFSLDGENTALSCEFRGKEESKHYRESDLYKNMGFLQEEKAMAFQELFKPYPREGIITSLEKKKEVKNPPLLFNLAELQNECAKILKISPDDTLKLVQELYEKKLCTYPRTDARVLSTAVSKEIEKNIRGLSAFPQYLLFTKEILERKSYSGIAKTKYCDDKKITDHYAIIPTGQGRSQYNSLGTLQKKVFDFIVRRFLSIFYPSAEYKKYNLSIAVLEEEFFASEKQLEKPGYLQLYEKSIEKDEKEGDPENEENCVSGLSGLSGLKKGSRVYLMNTALKEGETSPPKRYTSGTMILAMENAGKLIEDESLREQIKGSGIGTSATRAGILTKLEKNEYICLDKKNQQLSPSLLGEKIVQILWNSIPSLLNPTLTASWEKGLSYVEEGKIEEKEYMEKLEDFVRKNTEKVKST